MPTALLITAQMLPAVGTKVQHVREALRELGSIAGLDISGSVLWVLSEDTARK